MSGSRIAPFLWRWLTEPSASIQKPEAKHRARIITTALLLTILLVLISLSEAVVPRDTFLLVLVGVCAAYGFSRTRYYRLGGIVAIAVLWLLPTYSILTADSVTVSFVLTNGRLLLFSLLIAYILFSLRTSILLATSMLLIFLLVTPTNPLAIPAPQRALDFFLTTVAVFFLFVIAQQFDISGRRQAEAARHTTETLYHAIVEGQTDLVTRWLPDTTLTFVNEAYCRSLGRSRSDLIGTRFSSSLDPADLRLVLDSVAPLTPEHPTVTYEHPVVLPSGEIGWHQWTDRAIFDPQGVAVEYQSVGRDITERKRAEEALGASEARYRAIVEIQTEMICRWLPDGTLTFVNEAYCRYFAKTREELLGSMVLALIYEDDVALVRRMIDSISREQPSVTYQHRAFNPAGELRWHEWTDHAIFDEGEIVKYQSVGRDITDLKRAQQAEYAQREFAEALTSTAALISSTLNLDEVLDRILNQVAAVNPLTSAEIMLIDSEGIARIVRSRGYTDEAQRARVMELRFVVQETSNLRAMIESGKPYVIADVHNDPDWLDFDLTNWIRSAVGAPIRLEGATIGFLSMTSDTSGIFTAQHAEHLQAFADQAAIAIRNARLYDETRRYADELEALVKERTAELELERQRLRAILDGSSEGIFYTEDERIQFANAAFCRQTGYSEAELIGQHISLLGDPAAAAQDADRLHVIREVMQHSGIWHGEVRARRKNGTLFDAALSTADIGGMTARTVRSVTVVRDISREKVLQAQRSNFVAYASHELRTPITNMKTRLYLLRRRPENLDEHLVILDEVTERMRQLVEDLLDISRLEHGLIPLRRREVSVHDVIQAVITLQQPEAERKGLDLRCDLPPEPIYVSVDRERLIQVVSNLLTNALNYTPAGGTVCLRVKALDETAQIEVEDTGIGISPENLPYIFQPFYRVVSAVEGTGLGLSIAKEIIELHGGALSVRSEPNCGSVFTITLPLLTSIPVR